MQEDHTSAALRGWTGRKALEDRRNRALVQLQLVLVPCDARAGRACMHTYASSTGYHVIKATLIKGAETSRENPSVPTFRALLRKRSVMNRVNELHSGAK